MERKKVEEELEKKTIEIGLLNQRLKEVEQNLQILERKIEEIENVKKGIEVLKTKKEMLINIGEDVFIKTKLLSEELLVNVGAGVVSKKNMDETKEILEKRKKEFEGVKKQIEAEAIILFKEIERIKGEIENLQK